MLPIRSLHPVQAVIAGTAPGVRPARPRCARCVRNPTPACSRQSVETAIFDATPAALSSVQSATRLAALARLSSAIFTIHPTVLALASRTACQAFRAAAAIPPQRARAGYNGVEADE